MLLLVRMYPEQIAKHWEILKPTVEIALPPVTPVTMDRMNRVLQSLMAGQLVMHLVCEEEGRKIRGVITTSTFQTIDMVERQLLVYTAYAHGPATFEDLKEAWDLIKDLAKGHDCTSIVGYTNKDEVLKLVKAFDAETLTYVRMEV
jgi:hypothetical protein